MTTAAIIGLLSAIVPFVIWLWKRKAAKNDSPLEQHREQYAKIETPVAGSGDDAFANELDEFERLQNSGKSNK